MKTYKQLQERINMAKAKMGDVIKDFKDSDAPQFKGKSDEKRRQMAIAAKLSNEEVEGLDELSKKTLGSYIGTASQDKSFAAHDVGAINQIAQTTGTTASDREEREKLNKRHAKRSSGIGRAVDKLTKEEVEQTDEELKGDQHKIDANKNGKVDGHDFKLLRGKKK